MSDDPIARSKQWTLRLLILVAGIVIVVVTYRCALVTEHADSVRAGQQVK
jgi:hypothetical protein